MNVNKIKGKIKSKDPYAIADAFKLPLKNVGQANTKSRRVTQTFNERLTMDGIDWSSTLNAFLKAQACAFAVRMYGVWSGSSTRRVDIITFALYTNEKGASCSIENQYVYVYTHFL